MPRFLAAAVLLSLAGGFWLAQAPFALADDTARTTPKTATETSRLEAGPIGGRDGLDLPAILSVNDISRYRVIFQLQATGDWRAADKIIARLSDKVLMGHVLAQRYLHPTKYRSKYRELKDWMAKYHDHPQARQIYKLAVRRKPKNWRAPHRPSGRYLTGAGNQGAKSATKTYVPRKRLSRADRRKVRQLDRQFRWHLRKGWTKAVKQQLQSKSVEGLYHPVTFDRWRGRLGTAYYHAGRDSWALDWAGKAAQRSGQYLPEANWTAGLASWRLGRFDDARKYFAAVMVSEFSSPWLISAGAFWAARSALRGGQAREFNRLLGVASGYPRTFYGLLARQVLGLDLSFNWDPPPLRSDVIEALVAEPGGRRAFTLLQVGEDRRAERELRNIYKGASLELAHGMLALADRANMPSLAMRLGGLLAQSGSTLYDSTAFPLPDLAIKDGDSVDAAMILALIRQESGFNPRAKSHAGARGLMQIMPRTASFVARDRRYRWSKRRALFDPETNVQLGLKYIDILRRDQRIKGNLFVMMAAWNAGPGNLNKWRRKIKHDDDALLFIESMPLRETRLFVERVLTNLWIYRARLGQPTPTLEAVAQGDWPVYKPIKVGPVEIAEDERTKN